MSQKNLNIIAHYKVEWAKIINALESEIEVLDSLARMPELSKAQQEIVNSITAKRIIINEIRQKLIREK